MHLLLVLFGLVAVLVALRVLVVMVISAQAMTRARQALAELGNELGAAYRGGYERYRTPMPAGEDFQVERDVCDELYKLLSKQLNELSEAPLLKKLSPGWSDSCAQIAGRARRKVESLQSEAFWAQFPAGSDAARSRFRDDGDERE